ncbi:hypothetical protein Desaci_1962 [Desulfosporosinus acidiphilus SJ4]|uniref:Uncharacterized protein n=1 Tax=Desulfosporosinus acidiphilus (strain DSM 22704 / JCM 16185 / SJ4) TaxID=646529 RepID=I4D565_DESAJ|nr:hypothetical protein [Desulfosporosinus acidiphilus]AFM40939.1 hypothetical protein Desaci_1962 [Desulfosporosinus acidiphilus SJ4]
MSYQITGAVVNEQGLKFAIVVVNHDVVQNISENEKALDAYRYLFPDMPIILLGHDWQGKSAYYGQKDLVDFLAQIDPQRIPWRRYVIAD